MILDIYNILHGQKRDALFALTYDKRTLLQWDSVLDQGQSAGICNKTNTRETIHPQECVWAGPWQSSRSTAQNHQISSETRVSQRICLFLSPHRKCQSNIQPRVGLVLLSGYVRVTILSALSNYPLAEGSGPELSTRFSPSSKSPTETVSSSRCYHRYSEHQLILSQVER